MSVYLPLPVPVPMILTVSMASLGAAAVLKYRVAVRRAGIAVVLLYAVVLMAPHVGEPDRTEPGAIAVVRAIIGGELAYASLNEGYYDTLECLDSASCVPGIRGHGPFLEHHLAVTQERREYGFEFHAGPSAEPRSDRRVSHSAMTRFAVVAIPLNSTPQRHSFCGDDRGSIYFTDGGAVPRVEAGRCLDTRHSVADVRPAGR